MAWAIYALAIHRPGLAAAGVLLILCGYAAILGLEFVLMQAANRRDAFPAASLGEVCRAWLAEVGHAPLVFCWRQPFRSTVYDDRPGTLVGRRGLILAHGFVCNRGLWNGWYPRLIESGVPFIGVNLEPVFGGIDGYAERIEAAVSTLTAQTGLPPVIVAHSMGGLAVRAWLREAGPRAHVRVHHVVTLGSPHQGTALARWAFSTNGRQMVAAGAWVGDLQQSEPPEIAAHFTCVFSNCDNIVFPTSSALLPNARAVPIAACAHVQMVDHPQAFAEVMRWLAPTADAGAADPSGGEPAASR